MDSPQKRPGQRPVQRPSKTHGEPEKQEKSKGSPRNTVTRAQAPSRPGPSPTANTVRRPTQNRPKAPRRRRKRITGYDILRTLISFVMLYAVVLAVYYTLFFYLPIAFISSPEKIDAPGIEVGSGKDAIKLDSKTVNIDSSVYLPSDALSSITKLTITGDREKVILAFNDNETVTFFPNTSRAIINGCSASLTSNSILKGDVLYAPLDFYKTMVSGLDIDYSEESNKYVITLMEDTPIEFKLKGAVTERPIEINSSTNANAPVTETGNSFKAQLDEYEQYMNPGNGTEYLTLVNKTHPLEKTYVPDNLINVVNTRNDGRATQKMVEYAEKALEAFLKEAAANGYDDVSVTSGYRSYSYQSTLFKEYTNNEMKNDDSLTEEAAEKLVEKYSARPGTSEHQSGLCCDMHNLPSASTKFGSTDAGKWMAANAHRFGFILRFPQGKEGPLGGYQYEPWHFRYVGRYHATRIFNEGLCLEEYLTKYYPNLI